MIRLRLQKIGSLLGLLAILMSTLAPTISQAMAAHYRLGEALATFCSAYAGNGTLASHHKSTDSSALHGQACGYCSLFAHAPVVPTTEATLPPASRVSDSREVIAPVHTRVQLAYTASQPRAPPLFS
ncbi:DUF2946 domain-containing protein [Paraburkholderia caledonica]|jgi:hypothetical protein|uniref:DUF2946 domain-containing protein n=1 Tax=Paraburkholderia caledonica TaxID=134536 RepID=UPI000A00B149